MPTHRGMATDDFFHRRTFASAKKTAILVHFFKGWAAIMARHVSRLLYIDLFCGPGSYEFDENGIVSTKSEPVYSTGPLIVRAAARDRRFAVTVSCIFNDGNPDYVERMRALVESMPERGNLKFAPQYYAGSVNDKVAMAFAGRTLPPAMMFIDPFGYMGLTRQLIVSVLKDWGTDCAFFLNYDRINSAFGTTLFDDHLCALFGQDRVASIRNTLSCVTEPASREQLIMGQLFESLREIGGAYSISYRFRNSSGRTKQHIVFTSKRLEGYDVMKKAMARESSTTAEGVPTYEFVEPTDPELMEGLFPPRSFPFSIELLASDLKQRFGRLSKPFDQLVKQHHVGLPYIEKNYRAAILRLLERGAVTLTRPDGTQPRAGTCPADTIVRFKL